MTRLPSDSFLPSGAMESDLQLPLAGLAGSHASSSVISPLSLPGGVQYFEPASRPSVTSHPNTLANHAWSPTNATGNNDPPRAQPPSFLSPHLTPIPSHAQHQLQFQRHPQQRASSLSPTRGSSCRRRDASGGGKTDSDQELARMGAPPNVSVPVQTIQGTGSGLITVRRPAARIGSGLDSMMAAEPKLTAAEHEFRRLERLRQAFDDERRHLQASRDRAEEVYREMIQDMEADHARQRSQWEAERYELQTQVMQLQHRLEEFESRDKAVSDAKLPSFQSRSSSQISPMAQPGLVPLVMRDGNSVDSPAATMDLERPSKVIDVQEYHKDLEGIHLKENFVKMETFTDTPTGSGSSSKPASNNVSPPPEDPKALARQRSMLALKADENSRLTMHAGHTPTVSFSVAHTGASNTVVSSGSNTPTLTSGDGAMSSDGNEYRHESSEPAEPVHTAFDDDQGPAIFEPSDDDPELKGPLTLRNMPAKDEFFLSRLSDKLERAASGEDATPAVLRNSDDEDEVDEAQSEIVGAESDVGETQEIEEDVPLKLRKTSSNFGKPFGVL